MKIVAEIKNSRKNMLDKSASLPYNTNVVAIIRSFRKKTL